MHHFDGVKFACEPVRENPRAIRAAVVDNYDLIIIRQLSRDIARPLNGFPEGFLLIEGWDDDGKRLSERDSRGIRTSAEWLSPASVCSLINASTRRSGQVSSAAHGDPASGIESLFRDRISRQCSRARRLSTTSPAACHSSNPIAPHLS
jgi:hypothetical protein